MKNKSTNHTSITRKVMLIGIGLGALWWIGEAMVMVWVFHEGNLFQQIFLPSLHEIWMRSLPIGFFIMTTVYIVKRVKEALVQERKLLETLIDNIPDLIYFKDDKNRFISVNKARAKFSGAIAKNMIGKTDFDFFPQEQAKEAFADDSRVMESNRALLGKVEKITDADGTEHWVSVSKIPRHNDQGRVIGTMGISRDITEHKKGEKKIARLNAVLRAIRNVNQLINKEKDPNRLLQGICDNFIETKGYYYVWIALVDESGIFVTSAQAGLGERLSSMLDRLKSGQIVNCVREALAKSHIVITDNIRDICAECFLLSECKGRDSMTILLRHGDKVYGIVAAFVPMGVTMDEEEQLLFQEVAQDIGFALWNIEVEEALQKKTHDLSERVKELNCLYGISNLLEKEDISLEEILEGTVNLIPSSWQYPEITCSRVILDGQTFQTKNFQETTWKQTSEIVVHGDKAGIIEVFYLKERPKSDEGPFFKEERSLIRAIAKLLGEIIVRKKLEVELRIKEEAIASSINAIVLANLEGNLTYVNLSFLDMWGYVNDREVLGKSVTEFWENREKILEVLKALARGKNWMGELVARRKNGSTFDVQFLANIVENKAGKAICIMVSAVDITERKKIEQMKDDFVSLASHELRTPLTSVGGYVKLILDGDVGEISKEQREFLEIVSQNTQRLETLINEVLDIEKIESGRVEIRQEKVNLSGIVGDCINTFKVMAEGKGLKLEKEITAVQMDVLGDSDRLSQVFSNLLSNAIKYTKEGRVKVTAEIKGRFASVTVEDTGVGMSQDELGSVFTRFFRSEDSYVRKTTGTGLGLSIAKATIEKHNGDIRVESKLGVGTKVEVILPLLKEAKKVD